MLKVLVLPAVIFGLFGQIAAVANDEISVFVLIKKVFLVLWLPKWLAVLVRRLGA